LSIWLKNLIGTLFILHGLVYGMMLIPFPDMPGTGIGKFLMLRPTGKEITYTGSSMYRIEDGKIIEIWEAQNTMDIMKQLNPKIGSGQHKH